MYLYGAEWGYELDCSASGQGQVEGSFERGNEISGSVKRGEFLEKVLVSQEILYFMLLVS